MFSMCISAFRYKLVAESPTDLQKWGCEGDFGINTLISNHDFQFGRFSSRTGFVLLVILVAIGSLYSL